LFGFLGLLRREEEMEGRRCVPCIRSVMGDGITMGGGGGGRRRRRRRRGTIWECHRLPCGWRY